MGRAPCCDKANVKKGPWSPEEDAKLKSYIEENGTGGNWIALPQKIGLKRCGKSCRLRWLNYLRPNIKHGGFSEEEDQIICSLYISIGSRWSIIANQLPGRTDNDIKNYWNTRLKKKLLGRRKESSQSRRGLSLINQDQVNPDTNVSGAPPQTLSSTALERMQLHLQLQGLHNSFSFYNNPALWPRLHPLGSAALFQGQQQNTTFEQTHQSLQPPTRPVDVPNLPPMNANMQEVFFDNSNFNNLVSELGLHAEIQDLIYNNNGSVAAELGEGHGNDMNWWPANGFDESSPSSWGSASALELQPAEYVLGYDDL